MTKLVTAIVVAAIGLAASVASAAPGEPLTGTWSGKTAQDVAIVDPGSGEVHESEWSVRITVTALRGRLAHLTTTVRVVCPGPTVQDLRVKRDWPSGKGPGLSRNGSFNARVGGVSFSGVLGARTGSGRFDMSKGGCSAKGSWKVRRKL